MHVLVEGMKGGVWEPRFIEVQAIDFAIEHRLDHFNVIQNTIIGTLCNR